MITPMRSSSRGLVALLAVVLILWSTAQPAAAHIRLVSATPSDGAMLTRPPGEVILGFNEPPLTLGTTIKVLGPSGEVHTGRPRWSTTPFGSRCKLAPPPANTKSSGESAQQTAIPSPAGSASPCKPPPAVRRPRQVPRRTLPPHRSPPQRRPRRSSRRPAARHCPGSSPAWPPSPSSATRSSGNKSGGGAEAAAAHDRPPASLVSNGSPLCGGSGWREDSVAGAVWPDHWPAGFGWRRI